VHEASIVRELVRLAAEAAPPGRVVREVQVAVGRLTGVSPDALQFYFEVLREGALGPQARLVVRVPLLQARCPACASVSELAEAAWSCPRCGATLVLDNGGELDLEGLAVDDDDADHDRAEDPQEER